MLLKRPVEPPSFLLAFSFASTSSKVVSSGPCTENLSLTSIEKSGKFWEPLEDISGGLMCCGMTQTSMSMIFGLTPDLTEVREMSLSLLTEPRIWDYL